MNVGVRCLEGLVGWCSVSSGAQCTQPVRLRTARTAEGWSCAFGMAIGSMRATPPPARACTTHSDVFINH